MFKDITPLLADAAAFRAVVTALASGYGPIDKVVGIEARGFILAAPAACELGAGFVPVRKEGRLPGPTYAQSYQLEYGTATIEVHRDAFSPGERVLIIDDVLATGGTAEATASLVRRAGARDRRPGRHPGTYLPRPAGPSSAPSRSARCWRSDRPGGAQKPAITRWYSSSSGAGGGNPADRSDRRR